MTWSMLREIYEREGSIKRTAQAIGKSYKETRKELVRQDIQIKSRGHTKGQKKSATWREASSKHWNDPVFREKQRQNWIKRLPSMSGSATNSPLEKLLHGALIRAGISFSTQQAKLGKYVVDIEITQAPIIIEADGSHHLRSKAKDAIRDAQLASIGYHVFRFTGTQINAGPDACIKAIIDECSLTPEAEPIADIHSGFSGEANPNWQGGKQTWICEQCGATFTSWKRSYGRSARFCDKSCQAQWQRENPPINIRWANYRAKQMMIQSVLAGDCKSPAEMTGPHEDDVFVE